MVHRQSAVACSILLLVAACGEPAPSPEPAEGGPDSPPWQAARARGVDFRAVGQEPGWSLDVDRDGQLVYAGDYGSDTIVAPSPRPAYEDETEIWIVRAQGRDLVARVVERDCRDTMSGERFSHTVLLLVDDRELEGCGRELRPR